MLAAGAIPRPASRRHNNNTKEEVLTGRITRHSKLRSNSVSPILQKSAQIVVLHLHTPFTFVEGVFFRPTDAIKATDSKVDLALWTPTSSKMGRQPLPTKSAGFVHLFDPTSKTSCLNVVFTEAQSLSHSSIGANWGWLSIKPRYGLKFKQYQRRSCHFPDDRVGV